MKHTFYLALVLFSFGAQGQAETDNQLATKEDSISAAIDLDLAEYLPPLSLLIEVAQENSPDLEITNLTAQKQEYELGLTKKDWTNLVSIGAQYRYGGVSGGAGSNVTNSQALLFPEDLTVGAYAFLGIGVPLSYFVGRKDQIRSAEINVEIQESIKESKIRGIEEEVVSIYNRLLLLQDLIRISAEARENADLILEMSLERFRDGEISLDQLGASTSMKAKYASEYASLKTEFSVTFLQLERILGVSISKLQKSQN